MAEQSSRFRASGDVEVSTYLERAREKSGEGPAERAPDVASVPEAVVVIDFGSQFSMLIARRIRECRVYCELVPHDAAWETVAKLRPRGVVLSGGPNSVYDLGAPTIPNWVFEQDLPVLGICYGMQALANQLGGRSRRRTSASMDTRSSTREIRSRRCSPTCRRRCPCGCHTATASHRCRPDSNRSRTRRTHRSRR